MLNQAHPSTVLEAFIRRKSRCRSGPDRRTVHAFRSFDVRIRRRHLDMIREFPAWAGDRVPFELAFSYRLSRGRHHEDHHDVAHEDPTCRRRGANLSCGDRTQRAAVTATNIAIRAFEVGSAAVWEK